MDTKKLEALDACEEAIAYARSQPDLQTAWNDCTRPDWLLWLLYKTGTADAREIVLTACQIARSVLPHGDSRPLAAIVLAEQWASGDTAISRDDLRAAAWAAYAAACAAANAAARLAERKAQCDIIRKYFPKAPRI